MSIVRLSSRLSRLPLIAGATAALLTLAACGMPAVTRGNLVEDTRLSLVQVGSSTRDDVAYILGTPTTVGTFDDSNWYYIGQTLKPRTFRRPEILERRVLAIRFDETGVVEEIDEMSLEDAQEVELVERETPTLGRTVTFWEQMLGNLGRGGRGGED